MCKYYINPGLCEADFFMLKYYVKIWIDSWKTWLAENTAARRHNE
jgi:hypothetical protein